MANSSDWLGALAAVPEPQILGEAASGPGWLALLAEEEGPRFCEAPLFGGAPVEVPAAPSPPPPEPAPELPAPDPLSEACARAHAEGLAAGRTAAEAEAEALRARQRSLRLAFRALDEAASAVLAADLEATVLALCEGVIGEAALDPAGLRARCDAAARRIGGAPDALVLHLHPDDIALLDEGALAAMRLAPDASLERGSVVIEGLEGSIADGPAEWRRAIAAAVRG